MLFSKMLFPKSLYLHCLIALMALVLVLAVSTRSWATGEVVELQSYITAEVTEDTSDPDNVSNTFTVTWNNTVCTTHYNAYLEYWAREPWETTEIHLGSASAAGTQIFKTVTGLEAAGVGYRVRLFCGLNSGHALISDVWIAQNLLNWGNNLRPAPGTYSSEPPLAALTVSPGTLTPAFHSHTSRYTVSDFAQADGRITLVTIAKSGYLAVVHVSPSRAISGVCGPGLNGATCQPEGLTDADAGAPGFQVDLDEGENFVAIRVSQDYEGPGDDPDPGKVYWIQVTRTAAGTENSPATGVPTISGTAQVGQTLTASTSGIADEDGLTNVTFNYQWVRHDGATDTDIDGATGNSYTVAGTDQGQALKVQVSFSDDADYAESLTSAATALVTAAPGPVWSATLTVGQDVSILPDSTGYSRWGVMGGTLSTYEFSFDGITYEVLFLARIAGGLYLGLSQEFPTDFTLLVGGTQYLGRESAIPSSVAEDNYWWGQQQDRWSRGETVTVSLTPALATNVPRPERQAAPPTAYFRNFPDRHNGADAFTFRIYFNEAVTASNSDLQDHALEVNGGQITAVRNVNNTGRIREITVAPQGGDVTIVLPTGRTCDEAGALCSSDGQQLYNRIELSVPGPPAAPQNLIATLVNGQVVLTWDAPDDNTVTGYQILRRRPTLGERELLVYVDDTGSTATTYTDTGSTPGERHTYRVKARNAAGVSSRSNYDRVNVPE